MYYDMKKMYILMLLTSLVHTEIQNWCWNPWGKVLLCFLLLKSKIKIKMQELKKKIWIQIPNEKFCLKPAYSDDSWI